MSGRIWPVSLDGDQVRVLDWTFGHPRLFTSRWGREGWIARNPVVVVPVHLMASLTRMQVHGDMSGTPFVDRMVGRCTC